VLCIVGDRVASPAICSFMKPVVRLSLLKRLNHVVAVTPDIRTRPPYLLKPRCHAYEREGPNSFAPTARRNWGEESTAVNRSRSSRGVVASSACTSPASEEGTGVERGPDAREVTVGIGLG